MYCGNSSSQIISFPRTLLLQLLLLAFANLKTNPKRDGDHPVVASDAAMLTVPVSRSSETLEEECSKEHPSSLLGFGTANEMWHSHLRLRKHTAVLEFEQVSTSWGNDHILSFKVTSHLFVNDGRFMLISNVICEQICLNPIAMPHKKSCKSDLFGLLYQFLSSHIFHQLRSLLYSCGSCDLFGHPASRATVEEMRGMRFFCLTNHSVSKPTKELASAFLLW